MGTNRTSLIFSFLIKRGYFSLIFFILFASFFSSCEQESHSGNRPGKLVLALKTDTAYHKSSFTKSASEDEFAAFLDAGQYAVEILQESEPLFSYPEYKEMPEEVELPAGTYTLFAYKGENKPAAFENPYFAGTVDFLIEADMRTPITNTCRLANTRVTVNYTEDFLEAYPEYKVHLSTKHTDLEALVYGEEEERPSYFRSDVEGTELEIMLELVKLNETEATFYKPEPIPIEPRQNVNLLFKTDGNALNGISLVVTLNNDLEEETLDMSIPEYAWGEAKKPVLGTEYFEKEITDVTYSELQQGLAGYYYLDYTIPGGVGKCMLTITSSTQNTIVLDLATAKGASEASELGITITDQANENEFYLASETKRGRIHLTDVLAKLSPSNREVEYTYTIQITDAFPVNPNTTEEVSLIVRPNAVGPSEMTGTHVPNQSIPATDVLDNDITVEYKTDAGIQTATLQIKRNGTPYGTYNIVTDELPGGITYKDKKLLFNKWFVRHLDIEPGKEEEYSFRLEATDLMGDAFGGSPIEFAIKLEPVFEIVVPVSDIWGWKAKVNIAVSGLTEQNKGGLELFVSNQRIPAEHIIIEESGTNLYLQNLTPGTEYVVKMAFNGKEESKSFTTEQAIQVENGDMDTWYLSKKDCKYYTGLFGSKTLSIPFPYLNNASKEGIWLTNNEKTAKNTYTSGNVITGGGNAEDIVRNCFPTVVFEDHNDGFAAVIRSINASANNGISRGELKYEDDLTSRPSSVSFEYEYTSAGGENFVSDIFIYSGSSIIGKGSRPSNVSANNDYMECIIPITYTNLKEKATRIVILFASTDKDSGFAISTNSIKAPNADSTGSVPTGKGYTDFAGVQSGSTLKIDNVQLNYTEE